MGATKASQAVVCTILMCVSGCTSVKQERPANWPEVALSGHECPDISGTYVNQTATGRPSLFHELTRKAPSGLSTWELGWIRIQWTDESRQTLLLTVGSIGREKYEPPVAYLRSSEGDFTCKGGKLLIEYEESADLALVGGLTSGTRQFERAVDGSLLREDKYDVVGGVVVVPTGSFDNRAYYRWEQEPSTAQNDE